MKMSGDLSRRSIFISNLAPEVTETSLLNIFCPFGPILSVHIVRDKESRLSLGYGYVNYNRESDARQAITQMNLKEMSGQQIRVMASQSDPNLRKQNNANVFVKNLDKSVDNKRLYDTFRRFGPIMSYKLAEDVTTGQSKGFGFVQFESEKSAIDAIVALNGRQLEGKTLFCSKFRPKTERKRSIGCDKNKNNIDLKSYANIYVKNLSPDFDENLLKDIFTPFGSVVVIEVVHKQTKHFGFVSFEDSVDADTAVKELNGKPLLSGSALHVSRAFKLVPMKNQMKRSKTNKPLDGSRVYVKYFDESIDGNQLRDMFSPFGPIRVAVAYSGLNYYNNFGFVCFSSPDSAQKAVQQMNNYYLRNKSIYVSIAHPINERDKYLVTNKALKTRGMSRQMVPMF